MVLRLFILYLLVLVTSVFGQKKVPHKWSFGVGTGIEYARLGIKSTYYLGNELQASFAIAPYIYYDRLLYQIGLQIVEIDGINPQLRAGILYGVDLQEDYINIHECDYDNGVYQGFIIGFGSLYNLYDDLKLDFSFHISLNKNPFYDALRGFYFSAGLRYTL